jgi:hypothetical protein
VFVGPGLSPIGASWPFTTIILLEDASPTDAERDLHGDPRQFLECLGKLVGFPLTEISAVKYGAPRPSGLAGGHPKGTL